MLTDRHGAAYQRADPADGQRRLARRRLAAEYGGRGFGQVEQQIFASEAARADVPLPAVTLQTVGPTLQAYGTDEQKDDVPAPDPGRRRALRDRLHRARGRHRPGLADAPGRSGTATSTSSTARRSSPPAAHDADYIWLACRTDPDAPKHKGISILIVDTTDPGFSWTPIITCDGAHHVNATYYSDVRVPVSMRVGAENQGWRLITTQLNHERVMLGPAGRLGALHDRVRAWARRRPAPTARPLLDQPDVRLALAEAARQPAGQRAAELAGRRRPRRCTSPTRRRPRCSSSERMQRLGQLLHRGRRQARRPGRRGDRRAAALAGRPAKRNLVLTFGGGVNEVQRELIAMAGLGLPRVPR